MRLEPIFNVLTLQIWKSLTILAHAPDLSTSRNKKDKLSEKGGKQMQ